MELEIIQNSMNIEESKGIDLMSMVSSIDPEDEDSELVLNSESSEQVRLALESYITERQKTYEADLLDMEKEQQID
jgi:hypothetical protein